MENDALVYKTAETQGKKVLTFRKTRFIIADINDEGVRNENLFLALFLLQGNTS